MKILMPHDDIFRVGAFGKAYLQIASWYGKQALDLGAQRICMPFVGLGRIASGICREDTVMDVCDFQRISTGLIEGVFTAKKFDTNVDKPRYTKGYMYHNADANFCRDMDTQSKGFIDWVATHGTPLDLMAIGMAIPGQTLRGWMTRWTGDFVSLYDKFISIRDACEEFIPRPGEWNYWEDDLFRLLDNGEMNGHYDLLVVDPPRLSGGVDLYSTAWTRLNKALLGTNEIQSWTIKNYYSNLDRILDIDSDYLIFSWTEGKYPNPTAQEIKEYLEKKGTILDETSWKVHGKDIFAWQVRR